MLNATNRRTLMWIAILIALILAVGVTRSAYSPRPIVIEQENPAPAGAFFELPRDLKCLPGEKEGSPYANGRDGVCMAQKFVRSQADYEIKDGVGGTLV